VAASSYLISLCPEKEEGGRSDQVSTCKFMFKEAKVSSELAGAMPAAMIGSSPERKRKGPRATASLLLHPPKKEISSKPEANLLECF